MKKFISANWYKLMIGSSFLMASFGFMVYSISPANAKNLNSVNIPVNADGTISVKLSNEQLKALTPSAVQAINITQVNGMPVASYLVYGRDMEELSTLGVRLTQ